MSDDKAKETKDPATKTFSLKPAESNMLMFIQQHQQAIFSGLLSTIAMDRLAYHVTENTVFELNSNFSEMKLTEREPEKAPDAPAETTQTKPADGPAVVAAPDREQPVQPKPAEPAAPAQPAETPKAPETPAA